MLEGYYYLHENSELIFKPDHDSLVADLRDSDLVKAFWPIDTSSRLSAWLLLIEALAAGANKARVFELAEKWQCDDEDAKVLAEHIAVNLFPDGGAMCATRMDFINLQESAAGFGDTSLEAMANLAVELGYKPSKMWGATFRDLLK